MKHLDLFSGIGGFALAVDTVWPNSEHIFCDNDLFCQQVLKKHWPNSKIYGDIRLLANTEDQQRELAMEWKQDEKNSVFGGKDTILTGGFPCQPFSHAGQRKGIDDNRYLWPEMLRVIRTFSPTWVIAENVRGLLTLQQGVVFEQVCSDLESSGYEVQPFVIPAVAVNAPHRRDRVWFVAYRRQQSEGNEKIGFSNGQQPSNEAREQTIKGNGFANQDINASDPTGHRRKRERPSVENEKGHTTRSKQKRKLAGRFERPHSDVADSNKRGLQKSGAKQQAGRNRPDNKNASYSESGQPRKQAESKGRENFERGSWDQEWLEVATRLCGMDDGLPVRLDGLELTKAGHRTQRLKALGNSIVPQVAIEIMKAIKYATN